MRHPCSAVLLDFQVIDTAPVIPGDKSPTWYFRVEGDPRILLGYWDGFGFVLENGDPFEPCCWAKAKDIDQDQRADLVTRPTPPYPFAKHSPPSGDRYRDD
jgi:hypothetical protein